MSTPNPPAGPPPPDQPLSDLDVYRELTAVADALDGLAARAASFVGEAALQTVANTVRGTAKAVYEHSVESGGPH
jgi:hypothetical protein